MIKPPFSPLNLGVINHHTSIELHPPYAQKTGTSNNVFDLYLLFFYLGLLFFGIQEPKGFVLIVAFSHFSISNLI